MPASSSSSYRARDSSYLLLAPWPWLTVASIASPPDFTSAWERKVGAWKGPRGLRGPPPGRATASHRLGHLHLHWEGRASWGAGGSIGGWSGAPIGGCREQRGWNTPSIGFQGTWAVGRRWRGLISLRRKCKAEAVSEAHSRPYVGGNPHHMHPPKGSM
jgi:hypothetical protein